jgi:hypothetical protein
MRTRALLLLVLVPRHVSPLREGPPGTALLLLLLRVQQWHSSPTHHHHHHADVDKPLGAAFVPPPHYRNKYYFSKLFK